MSIIYDPTLVMLSVFVAIIGSLTGLAFTFGYNAPSMFFAPKSLMKGAIIIGGSIWSMHFIAMLAVNVPVAVNYNSTETLLSLCVAVFFTGVGLSIASTRRFGSLRIPAAGVLMGSGIASMHYLGMNAIRGCGLTYDFYGVALSVAVAIGASAIALWFAFRERSAFEARSAGWFWASQSRECTTPECMQRATIRSPFHSILDRLCFHRPHLRSPLPQRLWRSVASIYFCFHRC
jgi:NO-binding membrane sensor protein with MHYT domain